MLNVPFAVATSLDTRRRMLAVTAVFAATLVVTTCEAPTASGMDTDWQIETDLQLDLTEFFEPPATTAGCAETRRVGRYLGDTQCPPASGAWSVRRLFQTSQPDGGDAFCLYEWVGASAPDTAALPVGGLGQPGSEWTHPDCHVVASLATPDVLNAVHADMRGWYRAQIEAVDSLPAWASGPTTIAVLDSAVDDPGAPGMPGQGRHAHGRDMGLLAMDIACPAFDPSDPTCAARVVNHLALDLEVIGGEVVQDRVDGGYFGYQSVLAEQIAAAVDQHQSSGQPGNLVINLSVGWDERYNTAADQSTRPSVDAVQVALEYAACEGALVFASAGNIGGGLNKGTGPMYPAAWEQLLVPEACVAVGEGHYRPLLHAVGGVDGADKALGNGRPGGRSRLAATSFQASIQAPGSPAQPSTLYSGTSIGAAVASAAAALVWRVLPNLGPSEVIDIIYATGTDLAVPADFCAGGAPCDAIHRLSVCRALVDALAKAGCPWGSNDPMCAGVPNIDCLAANAGPWGNAQWSAGVESQVSSVVQHAVSGASLTQSVTQASCGTIWSDSGILPQHPCPDLQYQSYLEAPWEVESLPGVEPCGACSVLVEPGVQLADLYMGINNALGGALYDAQLVLTNSQTGDVHRFDLGSQLGDLFPGETYSVTGISIPSGVDGASLAFRVDGRSGAPHSAETTILLQTR